MRKTVTDATWSAVDSYFGRHLLPPDTILESVLEANAAAGLPPYDVTPAQGKLLYLLARIQGARKILELGTLGGYSTIWLARALPPDGRLTTLELDPKHAEVAKHNFACAGLSNVISLHVGDALDSLGNTDAVGDGPFDFIFIDADKKRNTDYFAWALKLARPGTLIVIDNVVRNGAVLDSACDDPDVLGIRRLVEAMEREPRIKATALQTVSSKGHDGFIIAIVD